MTKKRQGKKKGLNFHGLVSAIRQVHGHLSAQAGKAVNKSLTLRNWVIGWYISEFEFRGADRAEYGEKLLTELAGELTKVNVSNCNRRQLYRYLQFYRTYPQIVGTLSPQFKDILPQATKTMETVGTSSPQLTPDQEDLINRFSYSHLEQLFSIDDPLKRGFYEIECMQGNWSVRELKRQIAMTILRPFTKKVPSYSIEEYNGGMKFRNGDTLVARITPCLENGKTVFVDILDDGETGFGSTEYIILREKQDVISTFCTILRFRQNSGM